MISKYFKIAVTLCLSGWMVMAAPQDAEAAVEYKEAVSVETSSSYAVKVDAPQASLHNARTEYSEVVGTVARGETYDVISYDDGWALVDTGSVKGYLKVADNGTIVERTYETVDENMERRNAVVKFALQFVGNKYVWGGTDPNRGVDCSGFTAYIMRNVAGISLSHSSSAQAGEGRKVETPQAGDLIFYGNGSRINHVAMYIGNGQIVHASSEKSGIKISQWNYRNPIKIVDVLS